MGFFVTLVDSPLIAGPGFVWLVGSDATLPGFQSGSQA